MPDPISAAAAAMPPSGDARRAAIERWAATAAGAAAGSFAPASADASFRRYFRLRYAEPPPLAPGERSLIAMDAPPPQENTRPFIHVAALLEAAGVNAPRVLAADVDQGFLLLTDLGDRTYLSALDADSAPGLYSDAIDALIQWQQASREGVLPPYDEALLKRELDLFPDWYINRHLGLRLTAAQAGVLAEAFRRILASNLAQPRVFVHRDYHSRNLMVCARNPGVLDFQDAVYGPITYDLCSLLRDAYVVWDEQRQLDWAIRYWERARRAGLPVDADFAAFWRDFEWMGVQRQLKVLGIFARLFHRDGKAGYLADMPRVMTYLRGACARYAALEPLLRLLDELEAQASTAGSAR